jgi:hypothetical protein
LIAGDAIERVETGGDERAGPGDERVGGDAIRASGNSGLVVAGGVEGDVVVRALLAPGMRKGAPSGP